MKRQKTARLIITSSSKPLSPQLEKITGGPWNAQDYDIFEKGDFLRHKKTGKNFVVMSKSYRDNLNSPTFQKELAGYRFRFKLSAIRIKN